MNFTRAGANLVDHDLYVAIFNDATQVQKCLQQAIEQQPELASCLSNLTIFRRVAENLVEAAVVSIDEHKQLFTTVLQQIDKDLLVRFLPERASWTIEATANSFEFPETILNSRFSDYLAVMVPVGASSVFFIPPSVAIADRFTKAVRPNSSIVMKTVMSPHDVGVLRSSLQKVR